MKALTLRYDTAGCEKSTADLCHSSAKQLPVLAALRPIEHALFSTLNLFYILLYSIPLKLQKIKTFFEILKENGVCFHTLRKAFCYPTIPERSILSVNCLWKIIYSISIGAMDISAPACT